MTITDLEADQFMKVDYDKERLDDGKDRAHIINPPNNTHIWRPGMTAADIVQIAKEKQLEIVALCGHRFIPSKEVDVLDACDPCITEAGRLMREAGE